MNEFNEIAYNDFRIRAEPWQRADNGEWTVRVCIERHLGGELREQIFTAANSYKTRRTAVQHSLNFGRQIIDGNYEKASIKDLLL